VTSPLSVGVEPGAVLLVDDNEANRYVIGTWLSRAGFEILEAKDGASALELLDAPAPRPELPLIDVGLPDMTGFELCERIKQLPGSRAVPVVQIAAKNIAVADGSQGLHRGADAYLIEPVDADELLATVTTVLRYSRARRSAERLAEQLGELNRATGDLYQATDAERLFAAAVAGAGAVFRAGPVSVFGTAPGGALSATRPDHEAPVTLRAVKSDVLDALVRRARIRGAVAGLSVVPADEWRALVPADDALAEAGDVVLVAVRAKNGRAAVCLALSADDASVTDDRDLLTQLVQACALSLESLRTHAEEHALALTLQRSFLPDQLPEVPETTLAVRYVPASAETEIGGDFYEALPTPDGLLLAIGDVVGHSLEAALVMGEVRHALRAYAVEGHTPEEILQLLDTMLHTLRRDVTTVTLCLVLVEPGGRRLRIANAGHIPPLLIAPDRSFRYPQEHGTLLGLGGAVYQSTWVDTAPGTRLILLTDGLVEVRHEPLADNLAAFAVAAGAGPDDLEQLCDRLLEQFGEHKDDDIALLAVDLA
jgi:serine phosphatase RsbU (regulator of sigma subunit)/DNA-binding NarL/FixJ family response regulator